MGRNILLFVDGTGNEGGLLPDESRTNVYKLFRATRTGPDSIIEPAKQIAFYIPGVGTLLPGTNPSLRKRIWNSVQQVVGSGVTKRIIEGYAAIISVWKPGDRIYLFGFSRGAYIARCVGNVLEAVGVPTKDEDKPLSFESSALSRIAAEAVRTRYRGGLPIRDTKARDASAESFRKRYSSAVGGEPIGALPFFIGVWDTVAAIGWKHFLVARLIEIITRQEHPYDLHFPKNVPFARHAMAIDEFRRDFVRVPGAAPVPFLMMIWKDYSGLIRYGSPVIIPTLGEAIRRMDLACPILVFTGWRIHHH